MKVRDLNKVVNFPYEVRLHKINDLYTLFRERFKIKELPMYYTEFIDYIENNIDNFDNIEYVCTTNGVPELKISNIDIQDLVVLKITEDFIVYVGWEKNNI
ncbi:MAG: hypothetical protein IJZ36_03605 [Bacilli bacterium]|nr:hypothetical protein [Bacilli bacterium]